MSRSASLTKNLRPAWLIWLWAGLLVCGALILWFAPEEATLGGGIKWVYLHVAFIWTGMLGMAVTGGLGLLEMFGARPGLARWRAATSLVTLGVMVIAAITSLIATQVNWNGIFWQEPRMQALLRALALWVIAHFVGAWATDPRWGGGLAAGAALLAIIPMRLSPLVIHPQNPIGTSDSFGIQFAFVALFGVCLVGAVSAVWVAGQRLPPEISN